MLERDSFVPAVPPSVVEETTKSRGAIPSAGSVMTAQISMKPIDSVVVYDVNSYPTVMGPVSQKLLLCQFLLPC